MIKLRNILAPTDFSDFSRHSLRYACEFASLFGAELHLLHVVDESFTMSDPLMGAPVSEAEVRDLMREAESGLQKLDEEEGMDRVRISRRVIQVGTPFVEIVRYARQNDIDLIVMGTHGRSGLAHALIGSTAEKVVRKASCPVLTVRPEGHDFIAP